MSLDEFKAALLELIQKAKEADLDIVDIYDALNDEAEAFGNSFKIK